ncbi:MULTISPECIES: DMT family transporter [Paenibacillus]|uniref:DMT family transporter n=1 Tax=Paenibacillus TaxID=44249 RepID=UPI0003D353EE|nr:MULTISPECIES: DMT family transporter [Paenibacillus]AHC18930.1 multidrug transporter [Paenibacillus polymyxa CR1]ALA41174.1 multidrug transporter [Paenibacillus peoriae]APB77050.1 EamA family transporter [Paenibacillus polymyxa]APQ58454.1 multidrug transporter [Paenibacillus polymyxa]MBP1175177.1 drug/metabolite transporter (DMT)-like permease [Paenibacillus sp. PvR133]
MSQSSTVLTSKGFDRSSHMKSGFWLVAIGAALWGADPLFRIILLKSFTSTQIVLMEHVLLFLALTPMLWKHREELKAVRLRQVFAILFVSWGGSALASVIFTMALSNGDLNAVLLLQKLQPLVAIILARIILKEMLPRHFGLLIVVALFGTYLLTFGWSLPFGHVRDFVQVGSLLALGAAVLWGGSTVMGSYLLRSMKYETVTSLRFMVALPLLIVLTSVEHAPWNMPAGTWAGAAVIINLLLQALLPGLLSLLLYYKGLSTTKASYATMAELSFPMVGVVINWIAFQQIVTVAQLTGFMLIWITLFMISRQQKN